MANHQSDFPHVQAVTDDEVGEYIQYGRHMYFSQGGKPISRTRATWVTDEHNFNSRVRGEKEYLIVVWNGEDFTVLEQPGDGELRKAFAKYRGLGHDDAVRVARDHLESLKRLQEELDRHLPKCPRCGKPWTILNDTDEDCGHCHD